ncbi:MAG: translation initiation factor [Campylobacterota bacterium]|nr:translation initiation factor [Campylobacterota bacterium]
MTEKVRVHEIAKELGITSKDVVKKASDMGIEIKSANSSVSMEEAESLMNYIMNGEHAEATKVEAKVSTQQKSDVTLEKVEEKISQPEMKKSDVPLSEVKQIDTKEEQFPKHEQKNTQEKAPEILPAKEQVIADDLEEKKPFVKPSGLKIVKKKSPKIEETQKQNEIYAPKQPAVSSYGKISAEVLEEIAKKKKTKQSTITAKRHEHGVKIDIFGDSLTEVSMDMDEDQVVLLDLNEIEHKEIIPDEPKKAKIPKPMGRNSGKKTTQSIKTVSRDKRKKYIKEKPEDIVITHVEIPEDIRAYEFAEKVNRPLTDVIKVLFSLGVMKTKNDFLGKDEIEILSEEFGIEVTIIDPKNEFNYEEALFEEIDENATERPPVITIMGHVDHGKTTLLDAIRKAKVAQGEAGGITQHIGAYTIEQHGKPITFLDTPGHAAFSAMRQRGTDVTDIIVIVVAADDGVKPQTDEVVKMAKEAKVPVIIALNKMDKESANPDMVKAQMAERGLNPIDWGGDIEFIPVSAKTGMGIDDLLENILITAEVLELKANPKAMAKATVVESSLEKGRGPVATVIVQNGTLKIGDYVVCGGSYGRVKALIDENKNQIKNIGPSHTAVVVGLNEVPPSGEVMMAMKSDKEAREYAQKRHEYDRHKELSHSTKSTLDDMTSMIAEGKLKSLKVVLKTDVHGSLEAIKGALGELRNDEVKISIISSGVGGITENDVELVSNSENCVLLGFNVRPTGNVKALAKQRGVDIKTYSIIYQLIDDMTGMLTGMMSPKFREENTGQAEVRNTFKAPKGMVAGCVVVEGKLIRGGLVRVIRNGVVIHEGELTSLKRFKDDVEEIGSGYECGVMIKGYDDVVVGDVIETFKKIEQKVSL